MSAPVTLKDLARELGLSVPAVSLALRNAGNVSAATCKRVQQVAKSMGYSPNPHAAALGARARTKAKNGVPLAILQMRLKSGGLAYPISEIRNGILARSAALGYRAELVPVENPSRLPGLLRVLYHRGVQGIFLPALGKGFRAESCDWGPFSVVSCGRYDLESPFHTVRSEIFGSTRALIGEVFRRGYRKICLGLLSHDPPILDDFERIGASRAGRDSAGNTIETVAIPPGGSLAPFVDLIKRMNADAAIGFGVGYFYALREAGFAIPKNLAFAALHSSDDEWGSSVAGLLPPHAEIGIVAATRMDAMIRHRERGFPPVPEQIALPSRWQEGLTLPDLSGKKKVREF